MPNSNVDGSRADAMLSTNLASEFETEVVAPHTGLEPTTLRLTASSEWPFFPSFVQRRTMMDRENESFLDCLRFQNERDKGVYGRHPQEGTAVYGKLRETAAPGDFLA